MFAISSSDKKQTSSLSHADTPAIDFWNNDLDLHAEVSKVVEQLKDWLEKGEVEEEGKATAELFGSDEGFLRMRVLFLLNEYLSESPIADSAVNVEEIHSLKNLVEPVLITATQFLAGKFDPDHDPNQQMDPRMFQLFSIVHQSVGTVYRFFHTQGTKHHVKLWENEYKDWLKTIWTDAGLEKKLIEKLDAQDL